MDKLEVLHEKEYKYKTTIGQTAKGEWIVKEITVRDDAIKDLKVALGLLLEEVKEQIKKT